MITGKEKYMSGIKLNKHGVNANIKATILSEEQMRKLGFTDYAKDRWHFSRSINFPKENKYRGYDISFSVSINKNDVEDLRIDILDEDFCQPYDYQRMLKENPNLKTCLIVKEQVEEWMKYLIDGGILSGHEYGEYI